MLGAGFFDQIHKVRCNIAGSQDELNTLRGQCGSQRHKAMVQPPLAGATQAPFLAELSIQNINRDDWARLGSCLQARQVAEPQIVTKPIDGNSRHSFSPT